MKFRHSDHAFTAESLYGTRVEHAYSGALSFLRRKYTRDLDGVDVAVTGIPLDLDHQPAGHAFWPGRNPGGFRPVELGPAMALGIRSHGAARYH